MIFFYFFIKCFVKVSLYLLLSSTRMDRSVVEDELIFNSVFKKVKMKCMILFFNQFHIYLLLTVALQLLYLKNDKEIFCF